MKVLLLLHVSIVLLFCPRASAKSEWCRSEHLPIPLDKGIHTERGELATSFVLAVFYVVPTNVPYDEAVYQRIIQATQDAQAWYQCATGGVTWVLAFPEVVQVYFADQTREFYETNGDWWGSLLGEMRSKGLPIWSPGTVTTIWAHGAGWWAGGAQSCGADCGTALLGVEVFPEFNNPAYSGGDCPGGTGVSAWPCTPEGAFAHELGHTVGLPHPVDVPQTNQDANHSVMQTHWNYPIYAPPSQSPWGFLTLERQTLRANPFMKAGISLVQTHPDCDVVNLPNNGDTPTSSFSIGIQYGNPGFTVTTTNHSIGGTLYYWIFGDAAVSNDESPVHAFLQDGTYGISLRVSNDSSMVDLPTNEGVTAVPDPQEHLSFELMQNLPNPFNPVTTIQYRIVSPTWVRLRIHDVAGRLVTTLVNTRKPAGLHTVIWNGENASGHGVSSGVYLCALEASGSKEAKALVLLR
ncbi:MAG: FlgD immunoglobulin-like domain containing protein [Candidatus Krumholzibacteriia bacterium]